MADESTHSFEIQAGSLGYKGDITISEEGILSYSEDNPEELSAETDADFKRILDLIGNFIKKYGSLELFKIKVKE